jgi:hypothetical protein
VEIVNKPPKPERVITYTFDFVLRAQPLKVDVYPEQGDSVAVDPATGDLLFDFPRIQFSQVVVKANLAAYSKEESERLYIDAKEMQKKMAAEIRKDIADRMAARAGLNATYTHEATNTNSNKEDED